MIEIWKGAAEGLLEVSNYGRVRTKDRITTFTKMGKIQVCNFKGKIVSPYIGQNGYFYVQISNHNKQYRHLVHRLVGKAFIPGFKQGLSINHIDGNKLNNRLENLEWITLAENTRKQWQAGLVNLRGENHPRSKLTFDDVRKIKIGGSPRILAKKLGVSESIIYKIRQGKRWAAS